MTLRRASICALAVVALAGLLTVAFCPRPELYGDVDFSTAVEDRHGRLLRLALASDDRYRLKQPLEGVAATAIDATLLYEDQHFRLHPGVNPGAMLRAAWTTYVVRDRVVGASTITMQLARIRFSLQTRSLRGKLMQIARAIQLERHYSKDEILEAYLNLAPYGGNIEGIGTAALIYFAKPASQLSLPEALALAVIPQNPAQRNPQTSAGYAHMMSARARLLGLWNEHLRMTEEDIAQFDLPLALRSSKSLPFRAPHFARDSLRDHVHVAGRLKTTLDWSMQEALQRQIARYIERRGAIGVNNAVAMLVDHRSMEVRAAIGSADFFNDEIAGQVNGTHAKRSPGSTLKPFVYGLAIDQGLIHPMSLMTDAPKRFAAYTPENFDRGFMGPISAQDALVYSRNVPAIDLLARVGHDEFHEFLTTAGIAGLRDPDFYGLAMILGGNELTMEELVRMYAMLANGGVLRTPRYLDTDDQEHDVRELLSPEASFLVLDMLRKNPRPDTLTIGNATSQIPIAWKTGTSYAFRDAWTVGIVGPWVLAVWVGNFDGSSNPAFVGRQAAAPLFFNIVDELASGLPDRFGDSDPPAGLNLRRVAVCAGTGDLPGRHCPQTTDSWFVPGVSPIKVSDVHRAITVSNVTGERTCDHDPERTHEEVFEFWPSDILQVFRKAGIAVRRPPPWAAECALELQAASGAPPRITSPSSRLTYHLQPNRNDAERLPLTAITDADVQWLYWFVNDSFIAKVERDAAAFWEAEVGDYDIFAVDDLGRSAWTNLSVSVAQ